MLRLLRAPLFLVLVLTPFGWGEGLVYLRVNRPVIEQRLQSLPSTPQTRLEKLRALFKEAGCSGRQISEQRVSGDEFKNFICTLPGKDSRTIVIGVPTGTENGEIDRESWANLMMLPLLAESIGSVAHRYTYTFVAFDGKKRGVNGSSWYVSRLDKSQLPEIRAMISLEDVGQPEAVYKLAQNDRALATWLEIAASTLRMHLPSNRGINPISGPRVKEVADVSLGNAKPFSRAHVPAIALYSSSKDSEQSLDIQAYENTYQLLCIYLMTLDRNLDRGTAPQLTRPQASQVASSTGPVSGSGPAAPSVAAPNQGTAPVTAPAEGQPSTVASATPPASANLNASTPLPVFRAKSQLVVVDVTARDKNGSPIQGLKAEDFTVLENDKLQQVRVFESHSGGNNSSASAVQPALPPNTYTNRIQSQVSDTINVLLFDLLNTSAKEQMYAKAQMLKFLKAVPKGTRIELFVLGTHLEIAKGVTENSDELVRAAEKILITQSPLLSTEADREEYEGDADAIKFGAQPSITIPAGAGGPQVPAPVVQATGLSMDPQRNDGMDIGHAEARKRLNATESADRTSSRISFTLDALKAVAQAVSAYPGRKNLVWISSGFPVQLRPMSPTTNQMTRSVAKDSYVNELLATDNFQKQVRTVTSLLAAARIAVYPVDVHGLEAGGFDISNSNANMLINPQVQDSAAGYGKVISDQSLDRYQNRTGMNDVAEQTGGEVFTGSNDLKSSIARSMVDGASYYTLAYSPTSSGSEEGYRAIDVKVNRDNTRLAYRRGYYPKPKEDAVPKKPIHALVEAMLPAAPPATMLLMTAQVLPPDDTHKAVRLDYKIDLNGVEFADGVDQRHHGLLDLMAIAFDRDGKDLGSVANTMGITLTDAEYESLLRTGVQVHQELTLPPGTYQVRIGVMDRVSEKVGTVDAPLTVTTVSASKN